MRCAGVKSGIEIVGGQPMTVPSSDPCHESEPTTDTVWNTRTQSWMVQRPRTEPNTLEKKKVNVTMPNNILLYSEIGAQLSSEFPSIKDGNRCRDPVTH